MVAKFFTNSSFLRNSLELISTSYLRYYYRFKYSPEIDFHYPISSAKIANI